MYVCEYAHSESLSLSPRSCRQLSVLCKAFPRGKETKVPYFGSYRVELIATMFHRILDVHNFDMVLRVLTPKGRVWLDRWINR
jgi:hypothetical protein